MALILALICFILIVLFYTKLPSLKHVDLSDKCGKRFSRTDFILVIAVTLIYSFFAFRGLGDTYAPKSWHEFNNDGLTVSFEKSTVVSSAMLYSGTDIGTYSFEASEDGVSWFPAGSYEQNYVSVLKWNSIDLSAIASTPVKYVRISSSGSVSMGEIAFRDDAGSLISADGGELTDEQEMVPEKYSFMNSTYFDEVYHVRTAHEHLNRIWPYEISHPPLGKLIISVGISLLGLNPFGWRFMGVLFGILMVPIVYVFTKRLYGGKTIPVCCSIFLASDFMHLVQTRLATIDTYGVFFILLMYLFMYEYLTSGRRLDLALSGVFFGLGCASKWTCVYAGAGLGIIWLSYWMMQIIRSLDIDRTIKAFNRNILFCIIFFVLVPCTIYYCSYYAYGLAEGMSGIGMLFSKDYARIVLDNQSFMYNYHCSVTATHPYSSRWYQWMLDIRPILYYLDYGEGSHSSFAAWVNPVLCWAGLFTIPVLIYTAIARKDKKALFLLIGYFAELVPWMFIKRVTFEYHYFPCAVFLVLMLGYAFELMRAGTKRWRIYVFSLVALSVAVFFLFLPALTGTAVDDLYASRHFTWLTTWPV